MPFNHKPKRLHHYLALSGIACILISLIITAVRSYAIDIFNSFQEHDFMPPASQIINPDEEKFHFTVAGDTGAKNEPIEYIAKKSRRSNAKFMLYLGDLVRYRNPSHFKWIISEFAPKLKGMPFYAVPGNHEISKRNGIVDRSLYNQTFGPNYYWFGYGNTLFIGLDSSEEKIDHKQFRWLETTLKLIRPQFKYCVIFSHVPPVNPGFGTFHTLEKTSAARLEQIIRKSDINLLLFGHVHHFSETEFAGVPMYTVPSSGQIIRSNIKKYGYLEIKIAPEGVEKVRVNYFDDKDNSEDLEAFLSSALVRSELHTIAKWLLLVGFILVLASLLAFWHQKTRSK